MDFSTISLRVVVSLLLLSTATAELPNGECFVYDSSCVISDNFIGIVDNIVSAQDCKRECENNSTGCTVYSYYGANGVPFRDTCLIFNGCSTLEAVENCFTEEINCATTFCKAPVEGILSDNVIDIVPNASEEVCEAECELEEQCQFFTFYFSNSTLFPNTCFLLSEIKAPITPCQEEDACVSVSSNCENNLCGFLEDGILFTNGTVFTETTEIDLLTIGPCSARRVLAVVVGGGGNATYLGGAGSGYVEFQELQFSRPYVQFEATVGETDQQSMLTSISDGNNDVLMMALPGEGAVGPNGANGYSGGGAYPVGNGGSDGGNGQDVVGYSGGKGSGLDIRTIPITNFELRYVVCH